MKKKSFLILIVFVICLIGLLIWEFKPQRFETVTLQYDKVIAQQVPIEDCELVDELLGEQWNIIYPKRVDRYESAHLSVILNPKNISNNSAANVQDCDISVEVFFDFPGYLTDNRIIEVFSSNTPLRYELELENPTENVQGVIWIFLLTRLDTNLNRSPLFALPVKIDVISWGGVSPQIIRFSLMVFVVIGIGIVLSRIIKQDG